VRTDRLSEGTLQRYFGKVSTVYRMVGWTPTQRLWLDADGRLASDEQLLKLLRDLYHRNGFVTSLSINAEPGMPTEIVYRRRFGSLPHAYELAGIPHTLNAVCAAAYRRSVRRGTAPVPAPFPRTGRGRVVSKFSDDLLLAELHRMAERDGYVSVASIEAEPGLPSPSTFRRRFGSLLKAYELIGLPSDVDELRRIGRERQMANRRRAQTDAQPRSFRHYPHRRAADHPLANAT